MATKLKATDVVVIGLGAAGGVAVLPLAQAGLDVVGLEAGTWLTKRDFAPDEIRNNVRDWPMAVQKCNREVPTHRVNASAPTTRPAVTSMMNGVGGTTLHYWAQSWRLNPWDFKVVSETTRRYGASRVPKGSTVEDWPFGYDELEPYYDRVEHEIGVSGQAGNIIGTIDPRGNIFEGPRARPYPMPPLRSTGFTELMTDGRANPRLATVPRARRRSTRCATRIARRACITASATRAAATSTPRTVPNVTTIPRAQKTGHLKVVTARTSRESNVDGDGRATGVTYVTDGVEYFQPAKVVLLASYTYENSRLLLLSTSKAFPKGLSNNHGQVGRHYFSHHTGASVTALFPFNLNTWYGLPAQGVAVDNFADDNFDHAGLDFIGGGNLWVYLRSSPDRRRQHVDIRPRTELGRAVEGVRQAERRPGQHRVPAEDDAAVRGQLPRPRSGGEGSARRSGGPHHRGLQGQRAADRRLYSGQDGSVVSRRRRDRDRARRRRARWALNTHAYGGTRMGDNPETNVVNR